jgi:two-component sensor histidine kinase
MTTGTLDVRTRSLPARVIIRCLHGPRPEHRARRVVTDVMTALCVTADLLDLELAVNELVTNAWRHAPGPYELRIFVGRKSVKIAVLDSGADHLQIVRKLERSADTDPAEEESGRGLRIVTGLFPGACGAEPAVTCTGLTPAKQVWIRLPWPAPDTPGRASGEGVQNQ